jgi:hypothetical protein
MNFWTRFISRGICLKKSWSPNGVQWIAKWNREYTRALAKEGVS